MKRLLELDWLPAWLSWGLVSQIGVQVLMVLVLTGYLSPERKDAILGEVSATVRDVGAMLVLGWTVRARVRKLVGAARGMDAEWID
jgi:hypothetical protein